LVLWNVSYLIELVYRLMPKKSFVKEIEISFHEEYCTKLSTKATPNTFSRRTWRPFPHQDRGNPVDAIRLSWVHVRCMSLSECLIAFQWPKWIFDQAKDVLSVM
jgi:hypothetical protein